MRRPSHEHVVRRRANSQYQVYEALSYVPAYDVLAYVALSLSYALAYRALSYVLAYEALSYVLAKRRRANSPREAGVSIKGSSRVQPPHAPSHEIVLRIVGHGG
jgi:hypothetical protein